MVEEEEGDNPSPSFVFLLLNPCEERDEGSSSTRLQYDCLGQPIKSFNTNVGGLAFLSLAYGFLKQMRQNLCRKVLFDALILHKYQVMRS